MNKGISKKENLRTLLTAMILPVLILTAFFITRVSLAGSENEEVKSRERLLSPLTDPNLPAHIDARLDVLSRGRQRELDKMQEKAALSLQNRLGGNSLKIVYNDLTATPSRIVNQQGYLTEPSKDLPEMIARNFIRQYSGMFRFDEDDLNNLTLRSRAVTQEGTTILLFQQRVGGVPVYQGEVLVNVSKDGRIINVGGTNYPQMSVAIDASEISAAQAVLNAAEAMKISGFYPQTLGEAKILQTYGNLKPTFAEGEKFSGGGTFTDDISVEKVIFPLGAQGRLAYKFVLTTPQYYGIMWQNIVDAETGEILQRLSLTSFQNEPAGGTGNNRRGTFRPDVQNIVESFYHPGGASGKVFDTYPATLSGVGGVGRATRTGSPGSYVYSKPTYDSEASDANRFRYSMVNARNEGTLFFNGTGTQTFTEAMFPSILGQVVRGLPDASFPTSSSPFGWFYLPTGTGGTEISTGDANRAATRAAGYTISSEAQTRNLAVNSPAGNGSQPFSADTTPLGASKTLTDGRVLSSVIQSRYTEGNNVVVSDDRQNDDDSTRGVKGYSANRQFTEPRYDYYSGYELGGVNASGGGTGSTTPVVYPPSANPDVYPGAVSLFYFNNVEHDYLYSIGFTEQMWNFQFDNFGKGGAGGDAIIAEVQDGSGTDNANMGTPDDGSSPRMQMYLFTDGGFRRSDGDFDWDVIAHEHYHGVSNRSAGKGSTSCLGTPLVGESGGMGEGWSDAIASSLSDDDSEGEHVTGDQDRGIRRIPYTNYRYSYGSINDVNLNVRKNANTDVIGPDQNPGGIPYEVHDVGEVWAAMLWDLRELLIVKQKVNNTYPGIFFDGTRRMAGGGTSFYIGTRQVTSPDANHPINYRMGFATDDGTVTPFPASVLPKLNASDIVRPGALAAENASGQYEKRQGPLATAVSNGARLADKIVLRGLQLAPCNPSFVDMRDSMIAADREITGGENVAIIWRALTSHGVGSLATSSNSGTGGPGAVAEDFTVPANVSACEVSGPLSSPTYSLSNTTANTVTVTITPLANAADYVIQRSTSANGPFTTIATQAGTTYQDSNGINAGNTYYYQVHARRNTECVGGGNVQNITVVVGTAPVMSPIFFGADSVSDPQTGTSLTVNWSPATSANPSANIVYDLYRVANVALDNDLTAPTFTPSAANRIAQSLTGTSYNDTNLTTGQQYYYIVRARDTNNNQTDTNNAGNTRTKFNAPTTPNPTSTAFALENFSQPSANNRFSPPLTDSATPNTGTPVFQRVPNAVLSLTSSDAMYAPDFDPNDSGQGAPSNFATVIGPLTLTRGSILEFDHRFTTEATFDGGNLEVVLGTPSANPADATPFPNNTTAFDLNDYLIQNGYNGNLNGTVEGAAMSSPLQGRLAFTGTSSLSHVRAALGDFAPGNVRNPNNLPVYIRFHMSSDVGTNTGAGSGWYVDNVVVNNFTPVVNVSISGTITKNGSPLSGATVTLSGTSSATTTTNASGQYTFSNLAQGGNYLVTPSIAGNTFEPNSRSYSNVQSNVTSADFVAYDSNTFPRKLTVVNSFATPGQSVTVPISVVSLGDEEAFGFSLSYDTARLSNPQVACGSDASGCVITTNPGSGAIGVVIDNVTLTAGTRQLATVTFNTTANPPNTAANTPVGFTNSPTPRSVSNGNGDSLAASYVDGLVVFAQNLECDVAGRFTGDGDVLTNDVILMRQFVARNITPNDQYNEFQRADCGPRGTNGDGQILSNDLLQARRYAARTDALQQAAGPNQASSGFAEKTVKVKESNVVAAVNPLVRVVSKDSSRSATVIVPVEVDVSSDVIGLSFSVEFDRTKLTYQSAALGSGVPAGSVLTLNTNKLTPADANDPIAKLGMVIDSGNSFAMGTRQLVTITFTVASNAPTGLTPVTISGDPTPKSTTDSQANLITTDYTSGNVNITPPLAASVSVGGRVTDDAGNPLANAQIRLSDNSGQTRIARSNPFGYYRFDDVSAGETYVLDVLSKRYTFQSQVVTPFEDMSEVNFTGASSGQKQAP
ncbi:MAG TPA: M36 family metallopeptidase [Pyrinomonadaceae bacterium]|jgi:Zn-dependent metalloprotease